MIKIIQNLFRLCGALVVFFGIAAGRNTVCQQFFLQPPISTAFPNSTKKNTATGNSIITKPVYCLSAAHESERFGHGIATEKSNYRPVVRHCFVISRKFYRESKLIEFLNYIIINK